MTRMLRAATAGLVLGLGLVVMPTAVATARADPIGNCTTSAGTIVAVDFSHWGGPIVRGCGVNNPSGYALLHAAGFGTTGTKTDGEAFICRLGNEAFQRGTQYPTPTQDACVRTPPPTAYWSYWLAPAGQHSWTYSQVGSLSYRPKPGEVELWTFGATDIAGTTGSGVPGFSPDTLRAHNATPAGAGPVPTPSTASAPPVTTANASPGSGPSPTNAATQVVTGPPAGDGTTAPPGNTGAGHAQPPGVKATPTTAGAAASATTTTISGAAAEPPGTPRVVSALPAVAEHNSSGSIAPLLIGIGLVVVLGGGAAGSMVRRRRRTE